MGFGKCSALPPSRTHHCKSFYWDLSSIVAKSLCLATFLVVEGPRRVVSYAARKPEPKPLFTCRRWGYRVCACGHHYYDHDDRAPISHLIPKDPELVPPRPNLAAPRNIVPPVAQPRSLVAPDDRVPDDVKLKRTRTRHWYWPF